MRIVMLCDDVEIDRRILAEAETLISDGHEIILLASPGENRPDFETIGRVKVDRLRPEAIGRREWQIRGFGNLLKRIIARLIDRVVNSVIRLSLRLHRIPVSERALVDRVVKYDPDCVHAHDLPQLRAAVLAKQKLGVPCIYDSHELYTEIHSLTPVQKQLLRRRENEYIKGVDRTVTVNPIIASKLADAYNVPTPWVIENAVDAPIDFDPTARHDRFRQQHGISQTDKILLYQGWLAIYRGLKPLVEAMPCVDRHVHLVLMGYGEDTAKLQQLAKDLAVADRVHFSPAVSQKELIYWTASADVGVIPYQPVDKNILYCSPNKLYEFVQAGLPILSNDLPFLRPVIEENGLGLVRKLDSPQSFADAINAVFADDCARAGYKSNILKRRQQFSWKFESRKLLAMYRELLPGRTSPSLCGPATSAA